MYGSLLALPLILSAQYIPKGRAVRGMPIPGTEPNVHFSNAIYWETSWLTELYISWNRSRLSSFTNTHRVCTFFLQFPHPPPLVMGHRWAGGSGPASPWHVPRRAPNPDTRPPARRGSSHLSLKPVGFCKHLKGFTSSTTCRKHCSSPGTFPFLTGAELLRALISVRAGAGAGGAASHSSVGDPEHLPNPEAYTNLFWLGLDGRGIIFAELFWKTCLW